MIKMAMKSLPGVGTVRPGGDRGGGTSLERDTQRWDFLGSVITDDSKVQRVAGQH